MIFALAIVQWCNGSTTGFGSVCGGSNPPWTTYFSQYSLKIIPILSMGVIFFITLAVRNLIEILILYYENKLRSSLCSAS